MSKTSIKKVGTKYQPGISSNLPVKHKLRSKRFMIPENGKVVIFAFLARAARFFFLQYTKMGHIPKYTKWP
jgi:hypothetical protein